MPGKPRIAALFALALLAWGCGRKPDGIAVRDAWVRLPAVKGEAGAAYFRIVGGVEGAKLTGVSSPLIRRIELHESMTQGGMARMKPLRQVPFDYRGRIDFEPAGKHAMLFGFSPNVKEGARLPLTFAFDLSPPVTIEAEVRGPSGESHEH